MTDIIIIIGALTIVVAIALTAWSLVRSHKVSKRPKEENGVPVRMIGLATLGGLLIVALPTLFIGSFTDMCIITAFIMLIAATVAVIYSKTITSRLRKRV